MRIKNFGFKLVMLIYTVVLLVFVGLAISKHAKADVTGAVTPKWVIAIAYDAPAQKDILYYNQRTFASKAECDEAITGDPAFVAARSSLIMSLVSAFPSVTVSPSICSNLNAGTPA